VTALHDSASGQTIVVGAGPAALESSGPSFGESVTTLLGWRSYYGFSEVPTPLEELEKWIRRRLRCYLWKQWGRRGPARAPPIPIRHHKATVTLPQVLNTRIQLTLYVPPPVSEQLEAVRRLLDPIQASLIAAHVTLCREDELASAETSVFWSRLAAARAGPVTLSFGHPEPFNEHGILLPCVAGEEEFQALRRLVLGSDEVRRQAPHITLAHPRNPKATDNSLSNAGRFQIEATISFTSVCLIEQEGSSPWRMLEQYTLAGSKSPPQQEPPPIGACRSGED
jgi:2'-5' RNA ligase